MLYFGFTGPWGGGGGKDFFSEKDKDYYSV